MRKIEYEKLAKFKEELIKEDGENKMENGNSQNLNIQKYKNKVDSRDINDVWKEYLKSNNVNFCLRFNKFLKYNYSKRYRKVILDKFLRHKKISYYNETNEISDYILTKPKRIYYYLESIGCRQIIKDFKKSLNSSMVIGLGEVSVRETSIKLDHIYGIPYIPASTLKGGYRSFMEKEYLFYQEQYNEEEYKELIDRLFGTEDNEGELIFIDTYPEKRFELGNDIMNPHYSEYYGGKEPPTDDQDTKPIFFITLKKATFKFNLFVKERVDEDKERINEDIKKIIKESFSLFLDQAALGGKKSVGYGYFKEKEKKDGSK